MRLLTQIALMAWAALQFSCTATKPAYTGSGVTAYGINKEPITRSLFDSKDRTISEEDIQRLLNGRIIMPDTLRVAVFKYSGSSINRYYTNWWTDEEYLKTQQSFMDTLVNRIGSAGKVKKVIPVPALMVSANPNITQLRETAVRLQADVLVVYAINSDIYYKYKMFQKNEAKAFATCEAILMDTRTGVVPHSSIVTRDKLVYKDAKDMTDTETRKRAEKEAILLTLSDAGTAVAAFLRSQ